MDVQQKKMQFLGVSEIFQETIKIISTKRKTFTQIALAFVLPLHFLVYSYLGIMNSFYGKITQKTNPKFQKLSDIVSSETIYYLLFCVACSIFSTTLSLLATSAVVSTVASIYAARDVTFKQVMSVVPKVWKRLLVTILCVSGVLFALSFVAIFTFSSILVAIVLKYGAHGIGLGIIMTLSLCLVVFFVAIVYLTITWQLSNVVSVLEDSRGFKAMAKSKELLKGKMAMAGKVFILVSFPPGAIQFAFYHLLLQSVSLGVVIKVGLGILCILLTSVFFVLAVAMETVLYLVCKSFHHENVDESSDLSDQFHVYVPVENVPLKAGDVQLEKFQVV